MLGNLKLPVKGRTLETAAFKLMIQWPIYFIYEGLKFLNCLALFLHD